MNKTELKNFAINSRLELLSRVSDRAALYGMTEEKFKTDSIVMAESFQKVDGYLLSNKETEQRKALEERIRNNGFVQVIEEAAYTWFNRFIALRYMEVHNLLPIDMRVIPEKAGDLPQIVREAQNAAIEGIDLSVVLQLLDENKSDELYKYLIIALCNNLSAWLPQMFEKINDYTELLFPDGLLKSDSFLGMLAGVGEDNWQDIQVIGWLYQYYNTELKDETFALLKKNVKITKDRIGAATQLFTPEWIVRYMVENSLGRLWYEGHPDDALKMKWRYYLDEAKQEPEVEAQLAVIREERKKLKPEEIKLLDPCMGSGHILVYAFDVLMQIYRAIGYTDRDAVKSIIENNLYGLDIDDRAAQLAYFALMMKAAEYDKRFLKRGIQPNVCAIQESNTLAEFTALRGQMPLDNVCINTANQLINAFVDAKEYGSILTPQVENLSSVHQLMEQLESTAVKDLEVSAWFEKARKLLPQLAEQAVILQQKYDVVVTNPPYMGSNGMGEKLQHYLKCRYINSKGDLFAVFLERGFSCLKLYGYESMIVMESWMFLSSFEELRKKICKEKTIINLVHMPYLGKGGTSLGINFGTEMSVIQNAQVSKYAGTYDRIVYYETDEDGVPFSFPVKNNYYKKSQQENYAKIPGAPVAYWVSDAVYKCFSVMENIDNQAKPRQGLATGDNERFVRMWSEVEYGKIKRDANSIMEMLDSHCKYIPYNKGGAFRKWHYEPAWILSFDKESYDILAAQGNHLPSRELYFKESITWSKVTSSSFSMRYFPAGGAFDVAGCSIFADTKLLYILGFSNTCVMQYLMNVLSQTLNYEVGSVKAMPIIYACEDIVEDMVIANRKMSKDDVDSYEVSWDFQRHPMVMERYEYKAQLNAGMHTTERKEFVSKIEKQFEHWKWVCDERFARLKANEEKLNRLFIDIYGLQGELTAEVADKDVTVRKADLGRDTRYLISYAVGCMFGRYSLDVPGLAYAGGEWDPSKYVTYPADRDGILPITDDEYFQDDIVSMFIRWVKVVYGEETLEENLQFIANALNPTGGSAREVIRSYFMNDFFADHLKVYQKRPIYWQFDSGKQNGFKALMYLHRYDQDTVARLRTDYVHELQDRYRTQLDDSRKTAESGDAWQKAVANKRAQKLEKQLAELNKYEELVHHYADMRIPLDLDDGVKVNYAKLQAILTPIK